MEPDIRSSATSKAVAVLCLAMVVVGQVGRIDDRFDAINIILPYSAGLGLVTAFAGWGHRSSRSWLVCTAILVVSLPLILGELPLGRAQTSCDKRAASIRLIQYNAFKDNADLRAAANWLIRAKPDVIVLEEAARLATLLLPSYPYQQNCSSDGYCSTIIVSRIRPLAQAGAARGDPENRGALSAAWMRLPVGGRKVSVIGIHLGRPWPFRHYPDELSQLHALVVAHRSDPLVVAGDFNRPGWTFQMRHLETSLGLERETRGRLTWPVMSHNGYTTPPLIGIDHVLINRMWRTTRIAIGPANGSDHRAIGADLELCHM